MEEINQLSLFNRETGERLKERHYTNGSSQLKAINKIRTLFRDKKIVILKGGAGSGKSIIALEVIRAEGSGYITVPRIHHQEQYRKDYSDEDSRVYMEDEERGIIPIVTLKGKANFRCKLAKTKDYEERVKKHPEANFVDWSNHICNSSHKQNVKLERCPHYLAIREPNENDYVPELETYLGVSGTRILTYNKHVSMCHYYHQFIETIASDIVIINGRKLEVECMIGRLPKKKILVIDEFDSFLDEISKPKKLNMDILKKSIKKAQGLDDLDEEQVGVLKEIERIIDDEIDEAVLVDNWDKEKLKAYYKDNSFKFDTNDSGKNIRQLFNLFAKNDFLADLKGLDNAYKLFVYNNIDEDDMNLFYEHQHKKGLKLNIFGLNVSGQINRIFNKFDNVLLMSATMQNSKVLDEFYGINLQDVGFVHTEETIVGHMFGLKLGMERNFKSKSWGKSYDLKQQERRQNLVTTGELVGATRIRYFKGQEIKLKRFFHITKKDDIPKDEDMYLHPDLEELGTMEYYDDESQLFEHFKDGDRYLHKSTKMFRAMDLPNEMCRVIIFQKLPYQPQSAFHKAISQRYGSNMMWNILNDACERELIQGATRGIRNPTDWCMVCSPDSRVVEWLLTRCFFGNDRFSIMECASAGKIDK